MISLWRSCPIRALEGVPNIVLHVYNLRARGGIELEWLVLLQSTSGFEWALTAPCRHLRSETSEQNIKSKESPQCRM